jgi:hypothetical protein
MADYWAAQMAVWMAAHLAAYSAVWKVATKADSTVGRKAEPRVEY